MCRPIDPFGTRYVGGPSDRLHFEDGTADLLTLWREEEEVFWKSY